jgi:hypothetical protein
VTSGKRLLSFLAAFLLLYGCAALKPTGKEPIGPPKLTASSIRARAVVEFKKDASSAAGRAAILAKAPGSFRIEVFGPFGLTAALIASDGEKLFVNSEGQLNEFFWGDPELPYSFDAGEVVSFLTGDSDAPALDKPGIKASKDEWGRLREYSRSTEGRGALQVTLGEYREVNGAHIPFLIRIEDGKRDLAIKYTEVEINPLIEEDLFRLEAHSDRGSKEVD